PQTMLAALAGPETPVDLPPEGPVVSTFPPVVGDTFTPGDFVPGGNPGVTPVGGFVSPPGGPGGPGQPPVGPPTQPPDQPPVIPPDQPPVVPPDQPPVVPPDQPPVIPPVFPPPDTPPVITPPGGIPEPATWAMMIVGFFGVGA